MLANKGKYGSICKTYLKSNKKVITIKRMILKTGFKRNVLTVMFFSATFYFYSNYLPRIASGFKPEIFFKATMKLNTKLTSKPNLIENGESGKVYLRGLRG